MIAKKSLLILKNFAILNCNCESIHATESNEVTFEGVQNNYPIELDYGIQEDKGSNQIFIFVKVTVNPEKMFGYSFFSEGVGVFTFDENNESLSEKEKSDLIHFSAISICITNLRSYIANITSYYPFGRYNFASIDINDLLKKKAETSDSL